MTRLSVNTPAPRGVFGVTPDGCNPSRSTGALTRSSGCGATQTLGGLPGPPSGCAAAGGAAAGGAAMNPAGGAESIGAAFSNRCGVQKVAVAVATWAATMPEVV